MIYSVVSLGTIVGCGLALGAMSLDNLLPSFAEDLAECLEGMREINQYRSVTSHKMAYMSEGHMQQRCMESASAPMRSAGSSGGGSSSMRGNAYRTKAKMSKASKFSMF